jgi:hypothetical protein
LIFENNSDGYEKLNSQVPLYLQQILGTLRDNFGQLIPGDATRRSRDTKLKRMPDGGFGVLVAA